MVTSRNQHNCHNTAISDGLGPSLLGQEHLLLTRWPRERQDGVWSTLIQWKMSLPMAGDGAGWILGSLLTQNILGSVIPWKSIQFGTLSAFVQHPNPKVWFQISPCANGVSVI